MKQICPDVEVESKKNSSELVKAVKNLENTDNRYLIVLDNSFDNLHVVMEQKLLKQYADEKENVIEAPVKVYELLGAEVYLYADVEGANLTARVSSETKAKVGDKVRFSLDVNKVHVFDKESERVITN